VPLFPAAFNFGKLCSQFMSDSHLTPPTADVQSSSRPRAATSHALQAAIIVSTLYFFARLTGLIQTSIINRTLDANATDAYWAAFAIPDFINYLVAGGALSITFIPLFTQLQQTGRERDAWHFFSSVATLMAALILVLLVIAEIAARPLVAIARSGLLERPEVFNLTVAMTRVLLPAQWFFYVGGLLVGVLNAYKRFGASSWTGAIYNIVAIIVGLGLLWLGAGPIAFAWGILIGAFLGNFLLPFLAAYSGPRKERPQYKPRFDWHSPIVRRYFLNALPIMLGVSLPVVDQIVVGWFASFLPEGALTHLVTGNRVMIAAQGIVGQAASVAAFPFLSDLAAKKDWRDYSRFLRDGLRRLMFLTLPLSTLLILLARPLMRVLFGYGEFDNALALNETSIAFAFYCIGLFGWVAQQLVARGFYAMQDTLTPTLIGSVLTLFFIPLVWAAAHGYLFGGGVLALALATSIGAGVQFVSVLIALNARLSHHTYNAPLRLEKIGGLLLRTLAACVAMAAAGRVVSTLLAPHIAASKTGAMLQIICIGGVAILVFTLCAQWFAIPEWKWISGKVLGRLNRRAAR
jgi:putative peptidoglycan lipid II flippase